MADAEQRFEQLRAEADAAFAIESARYPILKHYAEKFGRDEALLFWRLAWGTGRAAGIERARELWEQTMKAAS